MEGSNIVLTGTENLVNGVCIMLGRNPYLSNV